jgi:lysophospholipase L1-like esterase
VGARLPRVAASAALAATSLAVALLLGEFLVRGWLPAPDRHYVYPPGLHREFAPDPGILPGVNGVSRFVVSSLGLRGDELPAERAFRVLAVGGSTTQCLYLDQEEAWPRRLQDLLAARAPAPLRVWVGNAGKAGRRLPEHRVQLEHLLPELGGIDAVVMLLGANDVNRRLNEDARYRPPDPSRPEVRAELLARAFDLYPRDYALLPPSRSALLALVDRVRSAHRIRRHWQMIEDRRGGNYVAWRELRARASAIRDAPPDLRSALDAYASDLRAVEALVRARGVRVVFLTQPFVYRDDLPPELAALLWMGWVGERQTDAGQEYYSVSALAQAYAAFNRTLLDVCRETAAECIDLEPLLPKDTRSFYDDIHFNEAGSERVARALFDHFATRAPFAPTRPGAGGS